MATTIFFCYAREDQVLLNKLKTHLKPLQREHLIDFFDDRNINAGSEWEREISEHLNAAQIILLLVSPDFLASDYCYGTEMQRAIERHERGEAHVIPIILRPVFWQTSPFGKLQALPINAKPVVSSAWNNWDEAFFDVVESVRKIVKQLDFSMSSTFQNLIILDLADQERLNRASILTRLRKLYILSHDNISPGIMTGIEPLPKMWVEEELDKMGENWRQENYYVHLDDDLNSNTLVMKTTLYTRNSQLEILKAKLRDFKLLWMPIYGKDNEKHINPFISDLQTKLILMSDQLVRVLSWNSSEIPKDVISDIEIIAAMLDNLGRMRFFLDGGLSVSKFNNLGDDLVKTVERVIEQLNSMTESIHEAKNSTVNTTQSIVQEAQPEISVNDPRLNMVYQLCEGFLTAHLKDQVNTLRGLWEKLKTLPLETLGKESGELATAPTGLGIMGASQLVPIISIISWWVLRGSSLRRANPPNQLRAIIIRRAEERGFSRKLSLALAEYLVKQ